MFIVKMLKAGADAFLESSRLMIAQSSPRANATRNLQNWISNTSCLAEEETAYLYQSMDLMTLNSPKDESSARLIPFMEMLLRVIYRLLQKVSDRDRLNILQIQALTSG